MGERETKISTILFSRLSPARGKVWRERLSLKLTWMIIPNLSHRRLAARTRKLQAPQTASVQNRLTLPAESLQTLQEVTHPLIIPC